MRLIVVLLLAVAAWAGEFEIPTPRGPKLKAVLHEPKTANDTVVVIAPGQGHHMDRPLIKGAAEELARRGYRAIRFNWAFFTAKGKPSPAYADEVKDLEAVLAHARTLPGAEQIVLAGKSLGSLASLFRTAKKSDDLAGVALLTLPVHMANEPKKIFGEMRMLNALTLPVLIVIGDHDHLCAPESLYRVVTASKIPPRVVVVAGGHSFADRGPDPARSKANTDQAIRAFAYWVDDITRPVAGETKEGLRIEARFDQRTGVIRFDIRNASDKPVKCVDYFAGYPAAMHVEIRRKWGAEWERLERKNPEDNQSAGPRKSNRKTLAPGAALENRFAKGWVAGPQPSSGFHVTLADFKWPETPALIDVRVVVMMGGADEYKRPDLASGAFRYRR